MNQSPEAGSIPPGIGAPKEDDAQPTPDAATPTSEPAHPFTPLIGMDLPPGVTQADLEFLVSDYSTDSEADVNRARDILHRLGLD